MGTESNSIQKYKILVLIVFSVLFFKAVLLQIVEGKQNKLLAENNRIKKNLIFPSRGLLFERHGELLAYNQPAYFLIEKDGSQKEIARIDALRLQAEKKDENLKIVFKRIYPYGDKYGHILGYLGEVTEEELVQEKLDLRGYGIGELIGRSGIESEYENLLRGRVGSELLEVNTQGQIFRRIGNILPDPGKNLTLSIDKQLQEKAVEIFEEKVGSNTKGAIIATDPKNGEILLLYSSPSFNNNIFNDQNKEKELLKIINDSINQPLLNRGISGLYPPGSTFKIVTSTAGLEEGKITPSTLINDPGVIIVNGFKFANWYFTSTGGTEGEVNLKKALARSVDTYFYKVGEMVGAENLIKWIKEFGLDEKFGIDLPSEMPGFIATPEWKLENRNERWFLGNTYHLSIGQGDIDITPLAVNLITGTIANGGKICRPRMLRIGAENTPYEAECRQLPIKKENIEAIKRGLIAVCSPGGTAGSFSALPFTTACKTGTAETGDGKTTHAWFTVFAPIEDPQIVLTVLVERGGEGSSVSAPIAKEILREYFKE